LNDAAVLSSATVDLYEMNAPLITGGTLAISDVDSPAVFVPESNVAGTHGHFSIDISGVWSYVASSAFDALNVGDVLTDTFTAVSADGTETSVTVNIHGTNDAAAISGDTSGTVTEAGISNGGGSPTATGDVSATDIDNPDNSFLVSSGTSAYGIYSITADGVWTYTLDNNNSVVNALYEGDTLSDSFFVHSIDRTAQQISIAIKGADDSDPDDFDASANGAYITTSGSNIFGTAGADSITGGNSGQTIYGGMGNDIITAGNGADTIYGGSGNDTISGSSGNDILYGGSGNDTIDGGKGNDIIVGGLGNDILTGGSGCGYVCIRCPLWQRRHYRFQAGRRHHPDRSVLVCERRRTFGGVSFRRQRECCYHR
jgi:VCBS repeat-containing protein